jgi:pimeloyl-ACP methyl ester carboxylesterase
MSPETQSGVTVVLVHGACHGAWCWGQVEKKLTARDWRVTAVDLPLYSLHDDAEVVRAAVRHARNRGAKVLLVGHSYGGVVISEAGHEADALVYLAGTMPDSGESATDLVPRLAPPELSAALSLSEDGLEATIDPVRGVDAFYNRCDPGVASWAIGQLRPIRLLTLQQAVKQPAWKQIPASYIVCAEDHAMRPAYQMRCAEELGDYVVLRSDHSPFLSAIRPLVRRLDQLAQRLHEPLRYPPVPPDPMTAAPWPEDWVRAE